MDTSTAIEQVEADVRSALGEQLPDREGFAVDDEHEGWHDSPFATDDGSKVVVPWIWRGVNNGLLGLDATGKEVIVRGITVIEEDGDAFLCRRYVDWLPALEQAGIVLYTRPIRSIDQRYGPGQLSDIPEYEEAMQEIARAQDSTGGK
jgi:hypothetical protein